MNSILNLKPSHRRERRGGNRDRRLLDGTMKYAGQFFPVDVLDLSSSGAYLVAPSLPEFSSSVTLTIDLPGPQGPVMVTGRIRRVSLGSRLLNRPTGFGVQFTRFFTEAGRALLASHAHA